MNAPGDLYIRTSDGGEHPVDEDNAIQQIGRFLLGYPWVELRRWGLHTRWTVMQRSASGVPEFLLQESWRGELSLYDMSRRE